MNRYWSQRAVSMALRQERTNWADRLLDCQHRRDIARYVGAAVGSTLLASIADRAPKEAVN